jgi:hypothetical protein
MLTLSIVFLVLVSLVGFNLYDIYGAKENASPGQTQDANNYQDDFVGMPKNLFSLDIPPIESSSPLKPTGFCDLVE